MQQVPAATARFLEAARRRGLGDLEVREFPEGTKTAAAAAAAIGCDVAAIVKSLVFMVGERPVVVLVPGDLRLDRSKLSTACGGETVRRAGLEEVRAATGYAAGGTPPLGYPSALEVFADHHLSRCDEVWAAAGTPTTVFPIATDRLVEAAGAAWGDFAEPGGGD
jgi:prolyl-tRNA editing enzyme YbaK/EbsC (Cys-tRNA(Pro) deacylase)